MHEAGLLAAAPAPDRIRPAQRSALRSQYVARVPAQHNYIIDEGHGEFNDVYTDDRFGIRDTALPPTARGRDRAVDHRGRERALDPRAVHLTGANPQTAATETDEEERARAMLPAWYDDESVSPRDPQWHISQRPGVHQQEICAPRAAVTARMEGAGQIRPPDRPVHWV